MPNDISEFVTKHDEGVRYILFGVLTVIISWVTYAAFVFVGIDLAVSNILSWFCAVLFAFVVNKIYVFRCTGSSTVRLGAELLSFFGGRIATGVLAGILFPALCAIGLGFTFLGVAGLFARGVTSVVEIVLNYLISKFIVFRKTDSEHPIKLPRFLAEMDPGLLRSLVKFTEIFAFAAVIYYTVFRFSGIDSEVGTLYFGYAEHMVSGKMPYSDFDAEYPPFAMLIILIPRLYSFDSFTYQIAFGVLVFVFLLAGLCWTYRISEKYTKKPERAADYYMVFTLVLLDFVLDRYDVFPMIMLIGSLYFFSREKYAASWIMLALGTVTKLYPALAAPVFLLYFIKKKEYDQAAKGIGICLIIGALCMLPFVIADFDSAFMFLTYHMDRGLQTEAPVSSVLMLLGNLGVIDVSYIFNYGSDNIYGPIPDAMAKVMMPLMAVFILAVYAIYAVRSKEDRDAYADVHYAVFAAVMMFMLVNKVLSSQYLIWIIGFMTIMMFLVARSKRSFTGYLFIVIVALTQLNLVVNYAFRDAGEEFSLIGILILVIRNALLIYLAYLVVRGLLDGPAPQTELGGVDETVEEI